jgi:hypothetical protein
MERKHLQFMWLIRNSKYTRSHDKKKTLKVVGYKGKRTEKSSRECKMWTDTSLKKIYKGKWAYKKMLSIITH